MKNNFVALDFETSYGNIPCSVGLVEFVDGIPVNEYYSLIKPYQLKFNRINSNIHGIKLEHVINEREFDLIWPEISHLFDNRIIVCHNSSFDISVLNSILEIYSLPKPSYNSYCTFKISQQCLNLGSYKLPHVAEHLKIEQFNHHNSLEDALICGKIFYTLYDDYLISSSSYTKKLSNNNLKYYSNKSEVLDPFIWKLNNIFLDKSIVVSGVFKRFTRESIIKAIDENGGIVRTSISSKTNYIVAGDDMGPSKLQTAKKLGIPIINEEELIDLLS